MIELMKKYKGNNQQGRATDIEVLAYIYTASLANPLTYEYTKIQMFLTLKSLKWQGKNEIPDFLNDCEELDDYENSLLDNLKRDIWNAQERAYKRKLKTEIKIENTGETDFKIEQMKLF